MTDDQTPRPDLAVRGLDAFAPYLMNRIMRRYNQTLQTRMSHLALSVPKMRVIATLASKGSMTVTELTVFAIAEQPTMSRTLEQMEAEGLIERRPGRTDNRVRECALTDAGRLAYELIWPEMERAERAMFDGVSAEEEQALLDTLHRMLRNIRENEI